MNGSAIGRTAPHDQKSGRFAPGNTEYRAKRLRVAERVNQLAAEYNARSPVTLQLLRVAAEHLDQAERGSHFKSPSASPRAAQRQIRRDVQSH